MKKIIALLLALMLMLVACNALAEVVTAKPGDELTLEVSLKDAGGMSAKIGIRVNSAPVTFVRAVGGSANDTVPPRAFNDYFAVVNLKGASISADGTSISGSSYTVASLEEGMIGKLTFRLNEDAAPGVYTVETYLASGSATVVGTMTFQVKDPSARVPGDANEDGNVNSRDALTILRYAAGLTEDINLDNADVNADGNVNSRDALTILRYAAGLDVVLK